ncbi:MAG: CHASE4 domain-containing protein [Acidobacteriota bacterium]
MTLRKKTSIIVSATLLALTVASCSIYSSIVHSGFLKLEERYAKENVHRVLQAVSTMTSNLNGKTGTWSNWDDLYDFVREPNPEFVLANASDTAFKDMRIDLLAVLDEAGHPVFLKAHNFDTNQDESIPEDFLRQIQPGSLLQNHLDTHSYRAGILLLNNGPMLVASRPVLTSRGEGPIRGTVILGAYLDEVELNRLRSITRLDIGLLSFHDATGPRPAFSAVEGPVWIEPEGDTHLSGRSVLNDLYGHPAILVEVGMDRDIHMQGTATIRYLLASMLVVGLIVGAVILLLIERSVLSRLVGLNSDLEDIRKSGDFSAKVAVRGSDEISSVAGAVNDMLAELEGYNRKLVVARDRLGVRVRERTAELAQYARKLESEIAERERVQEELKKASTELESRVEERTVELRTANDLLLLEIEERLKAQEALRESEERYRSLFNSAADGIYVHDLEGRLLDVNDSACYHLGLSRTELLKMNIADLDAPPYGPRSSMEQIEDLNESHCAIFETTHLRKDGTRIPIELSSRIVSYGGKVAVLSIARNISERKRVEKALREAKHKAEAASRAKTEFLATMSHELRTPLNAIIGFTELLLSGYAGKLSDTQEEHLKNVHQSGQYLRSLINDILELAKLEAGQEQPRISEVPLRDLVNRSIVSMNERAVKSNIKLSADLTGMPETIMADERKIRHVLYSIINNALKFTDDGGEVFVKAEGVKADWTETGRFADTSVETGSDFLHISVRDTGAGIREEDLERIFTSFEQADGSLTRKHQGSGLGLSLSKRLVELHQGAIWAESEGEGKGSIFHILLPRRVEGITTPHETDESYRNSPRLEAIQC